MTRKECEKKLLDQLENAWKTLKAFDPEAEHLDMFTTKDGHCVMAFSGPRGNRKRIVDGYKSPTNSYRFSE